MGIAVHNFIKSSRIKTITHDHDFAWERGTRYQTRFESVRNIINRCFPINDNKVYHAVINTNAKIQLKNRGINQVLNVPNVMDFNETFGIKDSYNKTLLADIGLDNGDIPLFQITRIVKRKGIDTAIKMIKQLNDKKIKLVITGGARDDENQECYNELVTLAKELDVTDQIVYASNKIKSFRSPGKYTLSDAYAHATSCTYFSTYEGFGNAFVECVLAKKPIFVNNYRPIYWEDIGSKGFQTVMTQGNQLTPEIIDNIKEVLYNKKLQREIGEYNFELGKKHFSFEVLENLLKKLFKK